MNTKIDEEDTKPLGRRRRQSPALRDSVQNLRAASRTGTEDYELAATTVIKAAMTQRVGQALEKERAVCAHKCDKKDETIHRLEAKVRVLEKENRFLRDQRAKIGR